MMASAKLRSSLNELPSLSLPELRSKWSAELERPVPKVSAALLRLALAWELQAKELGGLPRRTNQRLEQIAAGKTKTERLRPGMRLTREWNGKLHIVTIDEDGAIQWNERTWKSLSQVARAITGTRWSGPAFFGLRTKRQQ